MNCKICNKEFVKKEKNSKICSNECKKISKSNTNKKYNDVKNKKSCNLQELEINENEIFKEIKGYEDRYWISNQGRVYSRKYQNFLKNSLTLAGYNRISLDRKHFLVHRLVALQFIENPNPSLYKIIDHIDRNRVNNIDSNLRWADYKINSANSISVIDRKGCISKSVDKRNVNGTIYEYVYYRVYYYKDNKSMSKRFKLEENAKQFHQSTFAE